MRPLAKLAYAEEFEGDAERRTAAYLSVREDSSTESTYKLPAEVEFCKRSIHENHTKPVVGRRDFCLGYFFEGIF
ncbi:MAG: palindromic element RPE1 domain-containing protein [Rickettsia endosymbiont of Labidopullus appendiculatus]|nr:palindromic element RPE1 domain-containing protein [Rickettsia endosymbiont of Labidopullus appendiculatus]